MNKSLIILFFFSAFKISAQSEEELFSLIEGETSVEPSLLPKRMIFTQRFFWGERGVLRSTGLAPLNKQKREKELKLRRVMLTTHQTLGYATLLAMIAQGIIGGKLYNGQSDLYETHKAMGKIVNIGYF